MFGVDPSEVHIHVRRIPVKEIPASNREASAWLIYTFKLKDKLLSDFKSQGHFPNQEADQQQLSTVKCLANFILVISLTTILVYLTFWSSVSFKMYIVLSCAYLASATYLNFRPMPVINLS